MSFEPDTSDIRLRQLKEEIAQIREEQFAKSFPVGLGGGGTPVGGDSVTSQPSTGTSAFLPNAIRISKDTGVIDLLDFDGKSPSKDFEIGETITGQMSGATATIGDIDTLTDTTGTLTLVSSSIVGTFTNNENLNGSGAGGNNIADADGSQFTQTGRGHLNAGSASIIVETDSISSPFEIHFIDTALQNGQLAILRAQNGQTVRMRRAVTNDGNTGNLDLDESFDIVENALVLFQFQASSNVTPDGGWVPLITSVTAGAGGGGQNSFPILYPKENIVSTSGVIDLGLDQFDGHYKLITLSGDASLTFSNLPPATNGFKFYVLTTQDGTGGHVYTDLPNSVIDESTLLGQLQTAPNAQTLWQFSTADGGVNWHSSVINPQSSSGDNLGDHLARQDLDMDTFDIINADKIIFFGAGGFSFPTDASLQAMSTSGTGLQWNVATSQTYRKFIAGEEIFQITTNDFFFFDKNLKDVGSILFTDSLTFEARIFPNPSQAELTYNVDGAGSHHAFFAENALNPVFEMRVDRNKSNVDLFMVTNDINEVDQIQFDQSGGFVPLINHGERRLTGGSLGMSMNIPKISPFAGGFNIFFENDAQTTSDLRYRFEKDKLILGGGAGSGDCLPIDGVLGIFFCNGGSIQDNLGRIIFSSGQTQVPDPQILELAVSNVTRVEMKSGIAGFRMFTDIDMRTFNIENTDVLRFVPDGGVIGANVYGISADPTDQSLNFSVPQDRGYFFQNNLEAIALLDHNGLNLLANTSQSNPEVIARGFQTIEHTLGDVGMANGEQRLVNTDVIFGSGGNLINLSDLTAGAGNLDIDNDLGEVGLQSVAIDWDVSNFHRMVVTGDIQVVMNNLPLSGEWQEVTVEFLQDEDGGNEVTFVDIFRNGTIPRVSKGANRYTTVKFYSYNDGSDNILAFETIRNPEVAPFYQGIILARMSADQVGGNTATGNHLEFDTALFFDRLGVSVGGGQQKGIFSGFVKGRTYECVCHFAVENTVGNNPATMAVQWFDIAQSLLIGTRGTATDVIISEPNLHTATAYFIPNADTDTLEVQITNNNGNADTVISGSTGLPMSQVTIKDCGISEGEFNRLIDEIIDEDAPILPANPPIGFNVNSVLFNQRNQFNPWTGVVGTGAPFNLPIIDGEVIYPFVRPGQSQHTYVTEGLIDTCAGLEGPALVACGNAVTNNGRFEAGCFGFIRRVRMETRSNSLNKAFTVSIIRGDGAKAELFTVQAGQNTSLLSSGNTPIVVGENYALSFQTTDEQIPSGVVDISTSVEIEWGTPP